MKKTRLIAGALIALALCNGIANVSAQNLSAVLEKLNKIDARLSKLEAVQKRDFKKLQEQLSENPSGDEAASQKKLTEFNRRLNQLMSVQKNDINKLKKQVTEIQPGQDVTNLESTMALLKLQLDDLSEQLHQLKSGTNGMAEAEAVSAREMNPDEVSQLLTLLMEQSKNENGITTVEPEPALQALPIEISGFGDFMYSAHQDNIAGDNYEMGQVEVDLETNISEKVVIGAAIAYDAEGESFGLGAFTVDFRLFGKGDDHFRSASDIEHSGIIVGQFDVPFGIDWHVYPSIDRKLVTAPLAVENSHDGWNDYGVQGYLESENFNAVAYGTNGFGYEDAETSMSVGGRLGLLPLGLLEIGGSFAHFIKGDDDMGMSLMGADLQFSHNSLSLKGEYIAHKINLPATESVTTSGFYGQGMYDFGKVFLVARYGRFSPNIAGENTLQRFSAGAGWVILENCELRFEYQINSEENDNATFLQGVVAF